MGYKLPIFIFILILFCSIQYHESQHITIFETYGCDYNRNLFSVEPFNCKGDIKEMNLLTNILEMQYYQILMFSFISSILILTKTKDL